MACQRFAGQLRDVAAGGEPAPRLHAHLEQCGSCRAALEAQRGAFAAIDADVMRALRAEPSADFEARVRMRVAFERVERKWFGGWRLAAAASFLVLVGAVGVLVLRPGGTLGGRPGTVAEVRPPHTSEQAATPIQRVLTPPREDANGAGGYPAVDVNRTASAGVTSARRVPPATPRQPEVLVAPDQQVLIARLMGILRDGRLDEKAVEQTAQAPQPPGPIVVGELTVPPIVVAPTGSEKQQ